MSEPLITDKAISDMLQAHEPFNDTSHAGCAHRAQTVAQSIRDCYEAQLLYTRSVALQWKEDLERRVKALEVEMEQNRGEL